MKCCRNCLWHPAILKGINLSMHQSMQDNLCVISLSLIALLEPIQTETANYFSMNINLLIISYCHDIKSWHWAWSESPSKILWKLSPPVTRIRLVLDQLLHSSTNFHLSKVEFSHNFCKVSLEYISYIIDWKKVGVLKVL